MTAYVPLSHARADAPVAIGDAGGRTAGELLRDARAVAARLPAPAPGSEVLVICGDRYHVAVATLGAWLKGHAVALPPSAAPEAVRSLAARPQVATLLHDAGFADAHDLRPWLAGQGSVADVTWPEGLAADRPVATVYTSGSTGEHQPCAKTAGQLLGEARALASTFGLGARDVVLATVPPHHLYGLLFSVLAPLAAGAAFCRETPLHAETVTATARRVGATALVSVPAHLRSLAALDPGALPAFSRVFSSGAPLPRETALELLSRHGLAPVEVFGSSETGGIGWRQIGQGATDMSPETAWTPLPGVRVAAASDGRLLLESPFLPPGAPRPYPGDDRVELADGGFYLRGRLDGVVKIAGKRVAVAEVEHRLLALAAVADAAVVATESPGPRGHELVAAVVPRDPQREHAGVIAEVRQGLLQWFDPVVLPRRIRVVPALPREASGKLPRRKLLPLLGLESGPRLDFAVAPARTSAGETVVHEIAVTVPDDLEYFRGHFEGRPILPAVAQLAALVIPQLAALHPELGAPRRATRMKFARTVGPGDALALRLEVRAGKVRFTLARAGEVVTTGALEYEVARG